MATGRITIRVNEKLGRRLAQQASTKRQRKSTVVREALEEYLAARGTGESCYDLAARAGVIGVVKNAPPDLSTHPRHFAGFGK